MKKEEEECFSRAPEISDRGAWHQTAGARGLNTCVFFSLFFYLLDP